MSGIKTRKKASTVMSDLIGNKIVVNTILSLYY